VDARVIPFHPVDPDRRASGCFGKTPSSAPRHRPPADGVAVALAATLGVPLMVTEKAFARVSKFAKIELIR